MNHHHFRVSHSAQQELIDASLKVDYQLIDHLENCFLCNEEEEDNGLCFIGVDLCNQRISYLNKLRLIGVLDESVSIMQL